MRWWSGFGRMEDHKFTNQSRFSKLFRSKIENFWLSGFCQGCHKKSIFTHLAKFWLNKSWINLENIRIMAALKPVYRDHGPNGKLDRTRLLLKSWLIGECVRTRNLKCDSVSDFNRWVTFLPWRWPRGRRWIPLRGPHWVGAEPRDPRLGRRWPAPRGRRWTWRRCCGCSRDSTWEHVS